MNDEKEKTTTEIIGECDSSYISVASEGITMTVKREAKPLSEMTEKEILRQQLELLAEVSRKCTARDYDLARITDSMCMICKIIDQGNHQNCD